MRRFIMSALLAIAVVAIASPSAPAQVVFGQVGYVPYGYRFGYGYSFGGPGYRFSGFWGGTTVAAVPVWGPVAVGPWGSFGGVGVAPSPWWGWGGGWGGWGAPGWWAPQPPIVVVQPPPIIIAGNAEPAAVAAVPPAPKPAPNPFAAARAEEGVRRGDLLVVRPQKNAVAPAAAQAPAEMLPPPAAFARGGVPLLERGAALPAKPADRARFEVERARKAFNDGEYGRAAERLADAIAAQPNDPMPYFLLAQARTARGDYVNAVAAIRDGMAHAQDWPATSFRLREIYGAGDKNFDEHLRELKDAVTAQPNDPTLLFLLGYHYWFLGERSEAVPLFKKASRLVKDQSLIERFLAEAEGKKA